LLISCSPIQLQHWHHHQHLRLPRLDRLPTLPLLLPQRPHHRNLLSGNMDLVYLHLWRGERSYWEEVYGSCRDRPNLRGRRRTDRCAGPYCLRHDDHWEDHLRFWECHDLFCGTSIPEVRMVAELSWTGLI
jgi:hypothetical protein